MGADAGAAGDADGPVLGEAEGRNEALRQAVAALAVETNRVGWTACRTVGRRTRRKTADPQPRGVRRRETKADPGGTDHAAAAASSGSSPATMSGAPSPSRSPIVTTGSAACPSSTSAALSPPSGCPKRPVQSCTPRRQGETRTSCRSFPRHSLSRCCCSLRFGRWSYPCPFPYPLQCPCCLPLRSTSCSHRLSIRLQCLRCGRSFPIRHRCRRRPSSSTRREREGQRTR